MLSSLVNGIISIETAKRSLTEGAQASVLMAANEAAKLLDSMLETDIGEGDGANKALKGEVAYDLGGKD